LKELIKIIKIITKLKGGIIKIMADDEFAEGFDDFPEDLDDDLATPAPAKAPARGRPQPQPQRRPQAPPQRNTVQTQATASAPVQTPEKPRFIPFILPERNGVFDNQTGQPIMEDKDKSDLIIGLLTDIINRLDKIEQGL
jgi:hypothetical protein